MAREGNNGNWPRRLVFMWYRPFDLDNGRMVMSQAVWNWRQSRPGKSFQPLVTRVTGIFYRDLIGGKRIYADSTNNCSMSITESSEFASYTRTKTLENGVEMVRTKLDVKWQKHDRGILSFIKICKGHCTGQIPKTLTMEWKQKISNWDREGHLGNYLKDEWESCRARLDPISRPQPLWWCCRETILSKEANYERSIIFTSFSPRIPFYPFLDITNSLRHPACCIISIPIPIYASASAPSPFPSFGSAFFVMSSTRAEKMIPLSFVRRDLTHSQPSPISLYTVKTSPLGNIAG